MHTDSNTYAAAAALPSSHDAALRVSTAIALTALEVLRSCELRAEMRREWQKDMAAIGAEDAMRVIDEVLPRSGGEEAGGDCGCSHDGK